MHILVGGNFVGRSDSDDQRKVVTHYCSELKATEASFNSRPGPKAPHCHDNFTACMVTHLLIYGASSFRGCFFVSPCTVSTTDTGLFYDETNQLHIFVK